MAFTLSTLFLENTSLDRTSPPPVAVPRSILIHRYSTHANRPLFNRVEIDLPPRPGSTESKKLQIISLGGPKLPYIKSVQVNGVSLDKPIITHEQIADGGIIVFTMSPTIEEWGNDPEVLQALDTNIGQLVSEIKSDLYGKSDSDCVLGT